MGFIYIPNSQTIALTCGRITLTSGRKQFERERERERERESERERERERERVRERERSLTAASHFYNSHNGKTCIIASEKIFGLWLMLTLREKIISQKLVDEYSFL